MRKKKLLKYDRDKEYKITWHASKVLKGSEVEEALRKLGEKKIIHWIEEQIAGKY